MRIDRTTILRCRFRKSALAIAVLAAGSGSVVAQTAPTGSSGTSGAGGGAPDPNPYYVGVSQGFTYDSNVFRVPGGPSDVYSSTSLFGGIDQPIGRQRLYARGSVSLNRFKDESQLNNTSYSIGGGVAFDTIMRLTGGVDVGFDQNLTAPAASTAEQPEQRRNLSRSQRIDGRLRWGGLSVFTVEGAAGYSRTEYAGDAYAGSEFDRRTASLTGFYRPGARLRLGLGLRGDDSNQPQALVDPATGATQSNDIEGRHIDLLADYAYSAILAFNARLSRTRQTNSNPALEDDDFSGWTGALGASYRATGRLSANVSLTRDVGLGSGTVNGYTVTLPSTPPPSGTTTPPPTATPTPTLTPTTGIYENNRVTNAVSLGASYEATAKINVNASLRYARSQVASTSLDQAQADVRDTIRSASLGVSYAITRFAGLGCNAAYESRSVSGGTSFSTKATIVGCQGQLTWR